MVNVFNCLDNNSSYDRCGCEPGCEEVTINVIASDQKAKNGDFIPDECPWDTENDLKNSLPNLYISQRLFGQLNWSV